jgi:hypothetical protein
VFLQIKELTMGDYHSPLLSYDLGPPNPLLCPLYREKKDLERGGRGIAIAAISEVERGTEKIRQQKKEWVSSITSITPHKEHIDGGNACSYSCVQL